MQAPSRDRAFLIGAGLWLAVLLLFWPRALSFADEIAYVGQAKLLLRGQLQPGRLDPGIWVASAHGLVSKYPLPMSLLIAPLFWVSPRAVFALGVLPALALAWLAARVLRSWDRSPWWGLLVLAHPTLVIVARTVMADVLLSALSVAAWAALRRGGRGAIGGTAPALRGGAVIVAVFACLVCVKPIGIGLAGCLVAGEFVRMRALRDGSAMAPARPLAFALFGIALGGAATLLLTWIATGGLRSGYQLAQPSSRPFFAPAYVFDHGLVYARALLACPPLLVLGAIPWWRRREWGPLALMAGVIVAMSAYFFADRGASGLETLVVSQRLILPAVSFLMIGYAELLAAWLERTRLGSRASLPSVVLAPLAIALVISWSHQRWQTPMARALDAAAPLADGAGHALALTAPAFKAGLLYAGRTTRFDPGAPAGQVVLCSTRGWSHRSRTAHASCSAPGYRSAARLEDFEILVAAPPAR